VGIVELAQAVSGGPVIGPMRVAVQHEELSDRYGVVEERVIESWKQDDREARSADRQEGQRLAPTGEVGRFCQFSTGKSHRRPFDPIQRETYLASRPSYYLLGYSVDGQLHPIATVRIPGTNTLLKIDVSESLQEVSQRKRK
jgi:hypothetical protein